MIIIIKLLLKILIIMSILVNIVVVFIAIIAVVYYKTVTENTLISRYLYCTIESTSSVNDSENEHSFPR